MQVQGAGYRTCTGSEVTFQGEHTLCRPLYITLPDSGSCARSGTTQQTPANSPCHTQSARWRVCRVGKEEVVCAKGSAWLTRNGDRDAAWFYSLLQPSHRCPGAGPTAGLDVVHHAWALRPGHATAAWGAGWSVMSWDLGCEAAAMADLPVAGMLISPRSLALQTAGQVRCSCRAWSARPHTSLSVVASAPGAPVSIPDVIMRSPCTLESLFCPQQAPCVPR